MKCVAFGLLSVEASEGERMQIALRQAVERSEITLLAVFFQAHVHNLLPHCIKPQSLLFPYLVCFKRL